MSESLIIDPVDFNKVINLLRKFFLGMGFIEMHTQNRLSILAACEDPNTVATFQYAGNVWPLPQTGQMWLEYELLKNPKLEKIFCVSTSYRNEPAPVEGRHDLIFPMFEFEMLGNIENLISLETQLLNYLKYNKIYRVKYDDVALKYKTKTVEHEHEQKLYEDYGSAVFLTNFPMHTDPFWNMKTLSDASGKITANKVDVILSGVETIGSAERSTNKDIMLTNFNEISGGTYAKQLYSLFSRERVDKELREYLNNNFMERSGGGIGITRLIKSLKKENLL